jgi:hypothetical protein
MLLFYIQGMGGTGRVTARAAFFANDVFSVSFPLYRGSFRTSFRQRG